VRRHILGQVLGAVGFRRHLIRAGHHGKNVLVLGIALDRRAPDLVVRLRAHALALRCPAFCFRLGRALSALFLGDQRLAVCNRDLIVVGMDFAEGQKAVAIAAVIDESGLQRGLDASDFSKINIAAQLPTARGLEVEFLHALAAQHNHPGLLRMGRIDKHFVGH
jgi:hypothetical protein